MIILKQKKKMETIFLANSKKTNKQKQILRFCFFRQRDGEVPGIGIKVPWTRNFEKACPTTTTIIIIIKTSKQTKNKFGDFAILRKSNSDVAVMLRDSGTNFRVSRLNRICLS